MSVAEKVDYEALRRVHHPAPYLPDARQIEAHDGDNRARMACPDPGENLIKRYREVLSNVLITNWKEHYYLDGFRFEWALADLEACSHCHCTQCKTEIAKDWKDRNGEPVTLRDWLGCRTVHGHGWYMDLHRKKTNDSRHPVFVMTNCQGPAQRVADINSRLVSYR